MSLEQVLAEYFRNEYGKKAPVGTPTTNYTHGPGGLFGIAGLDEQVISGRITPTGLASDLAIQATIYTDPLYPYITGYEESGTEPSGVCDTCISGVTESCIQTATFGRVCRESKELEINRVMQRINTGEVDLTLVNDILGGDGFTPGQRLNPSQAINVQTAWAMVEIGMGIQNALVPMLWQGNPANNSAGGGYKEFPGLDMLIGTAKYDATTGTRCAALDSDVKDFNYRNINHVDGNGSFLIVRYVNAMASYLWHNASRQRLLPTQWAMALRPEAWTELLEVWPVAYFSTREVTLPNGNTNFIDSTRVVELRDKMQAGMYIDTVRGRIPVIVDDGIFEWNSTNSASVDAGCFASTIYFVPIKYLGSRNATYLEYLDYRGADPDISLLQNKDDYWNTDDGRFMWTLEQLKWCYTVSGKIEPRVILKTPQLAGKIEHVQYCPEQHFRDFDQDSSYFYKGGVEERESPSNWSDWNPNV